MSEIFVTSGLLRIRAEELGQLNEQFKRAVSSLIQEEEALHSQYEGDASDAFHSAFTGDARKWENYHHAVDRFVQNLIQTADGYERAEQASLNIALSGRC